MALDLIQIVDSIGSSPSVLLDLNTENPIGCSVFDAPPPPLRYGITSSSLTDGDRISSSTYGNRTLSLGLDLVSTTQDLHATTWQTLARQLDRETFWIKYQPNGATSPVFFQCYRSQVPAIKPWNGPAATRSYEISIPAYPAARGLRVDFGATTINNDPAAGSNGLFVDVTAVKGDLTTEPLIWTTNVTQVTALRVAAEAAPVAGIYFVQAEAGTLQTDTTLPGNDALMSGAGSNYTRTSFATVATLVPRVRCTLPTTVPVGDYRILVRSRASVAGSTFEMRVGVASNTTADIWYGDSINPSANTVGSFNDLGVVRVGAGVPVDSMLGLDVAVVPNAPSIWVDVARLTGAASYDLDYILLVPTSGTYAEINLGSGTSSSAASAVLDGINDAIYQLSTAGPYTGSPKVITPAPSPTPQGSYAGALPLLYPNQTTRLYWALGSGTKSTTSSVSVSYWPQYLYVRPATT